MSADETSRDTHEISDGTEDLSSETCVGCHAHLSARSIEYWNDHAFCHPCAVEYGLTLDDEDNEYWEEYLATHMEDVQSDVDFQSFCTETPPIELQTLSEHRDAPLMNADSPFNHAQSLDTHAVHDDSGEIRDAEIYVSDEEVGFLLLLKRLYQICSGSVPFAVLSLAAERKGIHETEWARQHNLSSGAHVVYDMEAKAYIIRAESEFSYRLSQTGENIIIEYIQYLAMRPEVQASTFASTVHGESSRGIVLTPARLSSIITQKMRHQSKRE
eukprot:TRINITY_DN9863_c0_g1_i2.p1 TRINITY_DN9863_c0_g1~~TRINITY_DN9863_c0_g1_i2.p1  ORF type:complete len:272 (-),score=64.17 TRINITY_DN9863_c0_g1_i2:211-1026(-)